MAGVEETVRQVLWPLAKHLAFCMERLFSKLFAAVCGAEVSEAQVESGEIVW